ncbi:hypothetical protein CDAR_471521 [Caerostris darwini]|uniref:Uncharacterized protein n=1 Tax=Caerostris darwini TaxID=1538125 RepID=A0AAV4RNR3_9ARAC|nr:hypothetical protein CDAR_471521 [Caerostris darwini]
MKRQMRAKRGCHIIQVSNDQVSYKSVSSKIKVKQLSQLKERTVYKCWEYNIYNLPDYPRNNAVAVFFLATMHDCFYAHLHRFKIVDSPVCPLCCNSAVMKAEHLLVCSGRSQISIFSRY